MSRLCRENHSLLKMWATSVYECSAPGWTQVFRMQVPVGAGAPHGPSPLLPLWFELPLQPARYSVQFQYASRGFK